MNNGVHPIAASKPEAALSEFADVPGSVRVLLLSAATDAGSWSSGEEVLRLAERARAFDIPLILFATGTGRVSHLLVEAFDLCFFDEQAALSTGAGVLTAGEAEIRGLINLAATKEAAHRSAFETARTIAGLAPLALKAAKLAVKQGSATDLGQGMALENRLFQSLFDTGDMREGTSAFLEKRGPDFRGE